MLGSVRKTHGDRLAHQERSPLGPLGVLGEFWEPLQLKQAAAPPGFLASWDLQQLARTAVPCLPPAPPEDKGSATWPAQSN